MGRACVFVTRCHLGADRSVNTRSMDEEAECPSVDEQQPMCKNQLEHEGGAFWCCLPIGHEGPHEPAPHEVGMKKRERGPPKRLGDEPMEQTKRKAMRKDEEDDDDTGPRSHHSRLTPKRSPSGGSTPARLQPAGYLTEEQLEQRKQYAGAQLAELQLKLSESMRHGGWLVVPKRANALEGGHYQYVLHPVEPEEAVAADVAVADASPGASLARWPFFTSAVGAEEYWQYWQRREELGGGSGLGEEETEEHALGVPAGAGGVHGSNGAELLRAGAGAEGAEGTEGAERDVELVRPKGVPDLVEPPMFLAKGVFVEVKMEEDGLLSSRYRARIMDLDLDSDKVCLARDEPPRRALCTLSHYSTSVCAALRAARARWARAPALDMDACTP